MPRHLTALEIRRITGTTDIVEQLNAFADLGIPAHPRNPTGHLVIECVAYTNEVRPHLTDLQWAVICDENIDTGLIGHKQRVISSEQSERNQKNVHRQHEGAAGTLDAYDAGGKETLKRFRAEPQHLDNSTITTAFAGG